MSAYPIRLLDTVRHGPILGTLYLTLLLSFSAAQVFAQTAAPKSKATLLDDEYPVAFGGNDQDYAQGVAIDASGNTYVVGRFKETVDFDPGPATVERTSFGSDDAFLASYNEDGAFRYVVAIGAPNQDFATGVAVDASGNTFITGRLVGTADFDPDPVSTFDLTGDGAEEFDGDVFVASYDPDGALRFAFLIDSSLDSQGEGIALDAAGNVYVIGRVYGSGFNSVEFDPDFADISIRGFASSGGFIAGYDNSGDFRFAERIGGDSETAVSAYAIHTDEAGTSHVTGSFSGTVDFHPDSGEEAFRTSAETGTGFSSRDVFVTSYDETGEFLHVLTFGGPGTDEGGGVAVDAAGRVFVTGVFRETVDLDPGPDTENLSSNAGSTDGFLASYDAAGVFRFAFGVGGGSFDEAYDVGLDAYGNAYVSGEFNGTVDFDPDPVGAAERTVDVFDDIFVASYTEDGLFRFVSVVGGPGRDEGLAIDVLPDGTSAVAGRFAETVDFDPDDVDTAFRTAEDMAGFFGNGDAVVVKYAMDGSLIRGYTPPDGCDIAVRNASDAGEGSFRQAILDANLALGAETICFDIAGSGPHSVRPQSALPMITDVTTIDGTTQAGASCDAWPPELMIELDGSLAGASVNGLNFGAGSDGSTVRGLVINRFSFSGINAEADDHVFQCNFIGTDVTGSTDLGNINDGFRVTGTSGTQIGGTAPGDGNLISGNGDDGIDLRVGTTASVVQGNFIGTNSAGTSALGNGDVGVRVEESAHLIGGSTPGARNVISGNGTTGLLLAGSLSNDNVVQGNFVGSDASGNAPLPNGDDGIQIANGSFNTIGGPDAGEGNVLSGNADDGLDIWGADARFNVVQRNLIGVGADGSTPLGNVENGLDLNGGASFSDVADNVVASSGEWGVNIYGGASDNRLFRNFIGTNAEGDELGNGLGGILAEDSGPQIIGGTYTMEGACCEGNTIAYNDGPGIGVAVTVSISHEKGLRGNRIFANAGLGVDLGLDGVTANDPQDADGAGEPNTLQNYPVLNVPEGGATELTGTLNSVPSSNFRVDVYRSGVCDASGYGEGEVFLGTVEVMTDASGDAPITFNLDAAASPGEFYTATAVDVHSNTSEFSACVEPEQPANEPPSTSEITVPADGATVVVGGTGIDDAEDPSVTISVSWTASVDPEGEDVSHTWQLSANDAFSGLLLEQNVGADTEISFTLAELAAILDGAGVELGAGVSAYHRVISGDGQNDTTGPTAEVTLMRGTLVGVDDVAETPTTVALYPAYPNPFNPSTMIGFALPESGHVRLGVFDLLGREVRVLVDGVRPAGDHRAVFEAGSLPSGTYLYRLVSGTTVKTGRIVLLK